MVRLVIDEIGRRFESFKEEQKHRIYELGYPDHHVLDVFGECWV